MELSAFSVMLIFALMAWACERIIWLLLHEKRKRMQVFILIAWEANK
jgi:hypothetical protein